MAQTVTDITIDLLRPFKGAVLTITADIGKDFAYHEQMTKALGAQVYLCRPLLLMATKPK